jgi:hypothetical protein
MRVFGTVLLAVTPALSNPLPLSQPVDCALGETCFIQNYVDADPGPGAADFTCGALSYDGHEGTDFALTSFAAMEAGVAVLAAAPGIVLAARDGMPDTGRDGTDPSILRGRECGNGVVIDHGKGWQTQYCHMKQTSIAVAPGDRVDTGVQLGEVGFSGRTQFPHLHLSVRNHDTIVDPFNSTRSTRCSDDDGPQDKLWTDQVAYVPGGFIAVGMEGDVPSYAAVKSGEASHDILPTTSPALVGWVYLFGGHERDMVEITLTDPSGEIAHTHASELDRAQAQFFRAAGKLAPPQGWQRGNWTIAAKIVRDGAVLDTMSRSVRVED